VAAVEVVELVEALEGEAVQRLGHVQAVMPHRAAEERVIGLALMTSEPSSASSSSSSSSSSPPRHTQRRTTIVRSGSGAWSCPGCSAASGTRTAGSRPRPDDATIIVIIICITIIIIIIIIIVIVTIVSFRLYNLILVMTRITRGRR
jgi:hypothetical protein